MRRALEAAERALPTFSDVKRRPMDPGNKCRDDSCELSSTRHTRKNVIPAQAGIRPSIQLRADLIFTVPYD